MDLLGMALANIATIMFLIVMAAGVIKVFRIANTLSEMKDLLGDIKRNTDSQLLAGPLSTSQMSAQSADNLLRAVAEMDHPVPSAPIELEPKN